MDDPKIQAIRQRIFTAQQMATHAVASIFAAAGSFLIQLRSHERGVEDHDDISAHIKSEISTCLVDNHMALLTALAGAEAEFERAAPDRVVEIGQKWTDRLGEIPYSDNLDAIGAKYIKAFPNDSMAQFLLESTGDTIGAAITGALPAIVNLLAVGVEGRRAKVIDSMFGSTLDHMEQVASAHIHELVSVSIDFMFEQVDDTLDQLAFQETKRFYYLVSEGSSKLDAACQVRAEFKDEIQASMHKLSIADQNQQDDSGHCRV